MLEGGLRVGTLSGPRIWALAGLLLPAVASADGTLERFKLENGLTVLMRPVAGAKEVAVVTFFSIGGYHDPEGRSGLAHVLEHIYVTAAAGETPARSSRALFEVYEQKFSARTGLRYTAISCVIPPERLAAELTDAAARMGALKIEESGLAEERRNVRGQEVENFEIFSLNAACALASERIRPPPHGGRSGGLPADLERITLDEVRDRWRKYYKPRNAVLVLAGAVKPEEACATVRRLFAPLPAGEPAPDPAPPAPGRPGTETVRCPWPLPDAEPCVCYAWVAPDPDSEDFAPFLVLLTRMGSVVAEAGPTDAVNCSRDLRYTPLVKDTVVLGAPTDTKPPFAALDPVLEALSAPLDAENDAYMVRSVYGFRLGLVTPRDGALREPGDLFLPPGEEDLYGLAYGLGLRETLGFDAAKLDQRLKALTEKDLEQARQLFTAARRAGLLLEPELLPK